MLIWEKLISRADMARQKFPYDPDDYSDFPFRDKAVRRQEKALAKSSKVHSKVSEYARRELPDISKDSPNFCAFRNVILNVPGESLTLLVGPAGTGKTYLAVLAALHNLAYGVSDGVIVARAAVGAEQERGALPGDIDQKNRPWIMPVIDQLEQLVGRQETESLFKTKRFECVPLSYIQGRTFRNKTVIVDESQNCTGAQLRSILTRMGEDSRYVVCGDPAQSYVKHGALGELTALLDRAEKPRVVVRQFSREEIRRSDFMRDLYPILEQLP